MLVLTVILKIILWTLAALLTLFVLLLLFKLRIELCVGKETGVFLRTAFFRFDIFKLVNFFMSLKKDKSTQEKPKEQENSAKNVSSNESTEKYANVNYSSGKSVSEKAIASPTTKANESENEYVNVSEKKEKQNEDEILDISDIPEIPDIPDIPEDKLEKIKLIVEFAVGVVKNVWGHLGVKIRRLHIIVATDDAAKTAIVYGGVCSVLSGFFAYIDNFKKVKVPGKDSIYVGTDFLGEKTSADVSVELSFYVWQIAHIGISALMEWMHTQK